MAPRHAPNHEELVEYIVNDIAVHGEQRQHDALQRWENTLWHMRVTGQFDMRLAMNAEGIIAALREALHLPEFPDTVVSVFDDAILMQALEYGYDPDGPMVGRDSRPQLTCRRCGQTGHAGAYPFSTDASSGLCDDCF